MGGLLYQCPLDKTLLETKKDISRFLNIERKLERNTELKAYYTHFMNECINFGHMKQTDTLPASEKTP